MRHTSFVLGGLVMWAVLGLVEIAGAQPPPGPMIHRVTLQPDAGVLTITGTALGPDLLVMLEGQPVPVLPGATDTLVQVVAPDTILTTPGMYRLTMVDPVRQMGDGFVLTSPAGSVLTASDGARYRPGDGHATATTSAKAAAAGAPVRCSASGVDPAGVSPNVLEGPTNTALGLNALASNTTGFQNTATGAAALGFNTAGHNNTASGYIALNVNTTGNYNTAVGALALRSNTTGTDNTVIGADALAANTTGKQNTASGSLALFHNTTGENNTASGYTALRSNTTGVLNTATGMTALYANTTGYWNTASGVSALFSNTSGWENTASGVNALAFNTTGIQNTASGVSALEANTTGDSNTANGSGALRSNTTGHDNTASGRLALEHNTTGFFNTATGVAALSESTTGGFNAAFGYGAGLWATTGAYNVFLGASVSGNPTDANTMRLGLPYSGGIGQNRTFIAGIHGTVLTGPAVQVFVDANGQLGTLIPPVVTGTVTVPVSLLQQQVQEQQAINAELRQRSQAQQATIEDLLARLARLEAANARRR